MSKLYKKGNKFLSIATILFLFTSIAPLVELPEAGAITEGWVDTSDCVTTDCGTFEGTKTQDFYEEVCGDECPVIHYEWTTKEYGDCSPGCDERKKYPDKCYCGDWPRGHYEERPYTTTNHNTDVVYEKSADPTKCHRPSDNDLCNIYGLCGDIRSDFKKDYPQHLDVEEECTIEIIDTRTIPCSNAEITLCDSVCGNGIVEEGEDCDGDGNSTGGETATCNIDCTLSSCGDGILNSTAGEQCDDGGNIDSDGCSANCQIETNGEEPDPIFHFIKVECPAWTDITGNGDASNKDATGGEYINFTNYPAFSVPYLNKPVVPCEIPSSCQRTDGWQFKFSIDQAQTQWVSFIGSTDSNGEATTSFSQLDSEQQDQLINGGSLWVSENLSIKPNDAEFAAIRCHTDALNGDNLEWINLGSNSSNWPSDVYCIAYNVLEEEGPDCGDGVKEGYEQCDGDDGVSYGQICTDNCTLDCDPNVNLVLNGGFENPMVEHSAKWDIFQSGTSLLEWIVQWISSFLDAPGTANAELHRGVNGWQPFEGSQYAELDTDWDGPDGSINGEEASVSLSQNLNTVPGRDYTISFAFSPRPNKSDAENVLKTQWNGSEVSTLNQSGVGNSNTVWTEYQYDVSATGYLSHIQFEDLGTPNSEGTFLDNVAVYCKVETGPVCGNQITEDEEECDGDAPKSCTTENGYSGVQNCVSCQWGACETTEYCGDDIKNGNEECDDGNTDDDDGCSGNLSIRRNRVRMR